MKKILSIFVVILISLTFVSATHNVNDMVRFEVNNDCYMTPDYSYEDQAGTMLFESYVIKDPDGIVRDSSNGMKLLQSSDLPLYSDDYFIVDKEGNWEITSWITYLDFHWESGSFNPTSGVCNSETAIYNIDPLPVCGNGIIEADEECDDSNINSEDGCSSTCVIEYCGDGLLQLGLGEECESGKYNGLSCSDYGFTQGSLNCNSCAINTLGCSNEPLEDIFPEFSVPVSSRVRYTTYGNSWYTWASNNPSDVKRSYFGFNKDEVGLVNSAILKIPVYYTSYFMNNPDHGNIVEAWICSDYNVNPRYVSYDSTDIGGSESGNNYWDEDGNAFHCEYDASNPNECIKTPNNGCVLASEYAVTHPRARGFPIEYWHEFDLTDEFNTASEEFTLVLKMPGVFNVSLGSPNYIYYLGAGYSQENLKPRIELN